MPCSDVEFKQLWDEYYSELCRYCARILRDRDLAEQVVSDGFRKFYNRRHAVDMITAVAYLRKIVTNEVWSVAKRMSQERILTDLAVRQGFLPNEISSSPDMVERVINRDRVMTLLDALPPQQRAVLVLRYFSDMTESQIALTLEISLGTVKGYISRAHTALRRLLDEGGE